MFTGIVEETGRIKSIRSGARSIELAVQARQCGQGLKVGDSVAVNGCCLTVVRLTGSPQARTRTLHFDLLKETWRRTNLQFASTGDLVNLERSLPAHGRLGGHFVTGHIDGLGTITRWERSGQDHVLDIQAPAALMRYMIQKGSVAVDGISLTVAKVFQRKFRIWIIPHTFEITSLQERRVGSQVNVEADLLGKYVERFVKLD